MAPSTKPLVLMSATPAQGHFNPMRVIAKELVRCGFEVTFVTSSEFKTSVEDIGCSYVGLEGKANISEKDFSTEPFSNRESLEGVEKLIFDITNVFLNTIADQYEALKRALQKLSNENPGRSIVTVNESFFLGSNALFLNAPGVKPTANISIGLIPMCLSSKDTAPFGPGLPPSGDCEQNIAQTEGMKVHVMGAPQKYYEEILASLGVTADIPFFFDTSYLTADRFLQLCIPSVEYPRSDAPSTIRFTGGLPKGNPDPYTNAPSWWESDIVGNTTKKIVAVSQGTIATNYADLIIPTMQGLASSPDILVVVALGAKGATLPEGTIIPENARVADYIPFDELLPHSEVFVTNGGYGGFQHAIAHGTPLVIGGISEDKLEVSARAEWAGVAINLKTATPTKEAVAEAVETVIRDGKYKKRALELESEMKSYDPMGIIIGTIEELGAGGK